MHFRCDIIWLTFYHLILLSCSGYHNAIETLPIINFIKHGDWRHDNIMMSHFTTLFSMKLFPHSSAIKVKSMQRSGTEAIRTQLQPSKPKREITYITNSQNTKRTYGQQSEQLFPKRWQLSNRNQTKNNMNKCKVKHHRNSDTKNR